jgi:subtilisin family serine protease
MTPLMRRISILSALLAGVLAMGHARAPATSAVSATAPLGSVTTVQVRLDNQGQPAVTAQLYEAFDAQPMTTDSRASGPLRVSPPSGPGPITSDLLAAFASAPDGQSDMIIYLADQADLSTAAAMPDWNLRGTAVVATLQKEAAATQATLLALLQQSDYNPRSFWIVNALEVKGRRSLAEKLAGQQGVALVAANVQHTLSSGPVLGSPDGAEQLGWGLQRIRVPSVWADWGVRGAGITVANLDTGVAYTHTALLHQYRGWSPNGISNDYNWYDAAGGKPLLQPGDPVGHGTHTMGIMVGASAGGYSGLGVAPAAHWIAVRGCDGMVCSDAALIAGAQWILAPTDLAGKNPRPDLRPQVVNNSWGQAGDSPWYSDYVTAWNAAGIFSAFANGNNGAFGGCENTLTPGNYANSFAVGATDDSDLAAQFSSRGPTGDGRTKPDISAPGVNIPSTWPDGSVRLLSGTSMAAPHVAGVVALLWSANPSLIGDLAATERVLTTTALLRPTTECSSPSTTTPNNVYGWGRLDARAAVQEARVDVPWMSLPATIELPANGAGQFTLTLDGRQVAGPGTYTARILVMRNTVLASIPVIFTVQPAANTAGLRGRLTDIWQGGGVYGRVQIGAGPAVQSDANGFYSATLPFGSYGLTASATGYFSSTLDVMIGPPAAADFILQPDLPHLEVNSAPLSATLAFAQRVVMPITVTNAGSQALQITTYVPPLDWVVEQAGAPAGTLYDLSGVTAISLTDDSIYTQPLQLGFRVPIYGALVDRLYLSSNGWVSAAAPTYAEPLASCLPSGSLPPWSLAPFWADLDPGVGGAVRFAQVNATTFVVSFEQVPPWRQKPDPAGPTYTFQLVLHANGNVEFLYGPMGGLPDRWSVGASFDETRGQQLACYRTNPILSGTVWQLRNQPDSNLWLHASTSALEVEPGQSVAFDAVLSGYGYAGWHTDPFVGTLRLLSNDPGQPSVDLPARASIGPAAHQVVLPVINR